MVIGTWVDLIVQSLQELWLQLIGFLPSLIGAFVVFLVGLIVATGLEKLVERIVFYLKIDTLLKKAGVESYVHRMHLRLNTGYFFGRIAFWFIAIAFLLASSDILNFSALSGFLRQVLAYIPNVFIAALILLASLYAAHFLRGLVRASVLSTGTHAHAAKTLSSTVWWVVVIFGLLAALGQLRVAEVIINTLITGVIAMLALAGGIAFGLGGRDFAGRLLEKAEDTMSNHENP